MSLSGALGIAQSALANTAAQTALLSQNIANVGNADYSRRTATTLTQTNGGVLTGPTRRATDTALLSSLLSAQGASASQQALSDGLTRIASTLGLDTAATKSTGTATDNAPATAVGALAAALQQYAADPSDGALATAAVSAARALASNLNGAAASVQAVRQQADADIATAVGTINGLLAQFQATNAAITGGLATGKDVSAAQDTRDGLLKQLSSQIGITAVADPNGGTSIYTDGGATLFQGGTARTVGFTPTATYTAATVGGAVSVDGVPITGANAVLPLASGALAGLTALRDTAAPSYGNQLDQLAAGLVAAFGDSGPSGTAPTLPGLFVASGTAGMPATQTGLAATIAVNPKVDPTAGGIATRLRDGVNSATAGYGYNAAGAAGYSAHLDAQVAALGETRSFAAASGGAGSGTLAGYAASSASWLEAQRQAASDGATYQSAVAASATTALSNATGVNLDEQLSDTLDVEHAYQASAQLLNTVNAMYSSLLQAFN